MKKKFFLMLLVISVITSACVHDDLSDNEKGFTANAISFRTLTDKPTKATVTDITNILSFTVAGWWDKTDQTTTFEYSSDLDEGQWLFDGAPVVRSEGGASWEYAPLRFWPTLGKVHFVAYSPASSVNVKKGLRGTTDEIIEYEVPGISMNSGQEDFLVAQNNGQKEGQVTLHFQHALSRVLFQAKDATSDINYTIESIELVNVYTRGKLDLNAQEIGSGFSYDDSSKPVLTLWTDLSEPGNVMVDHSSAPILLTDEYQSIGGVTNALMVLPQTTTLGAVETSGSNRNTPTNSNYVSDGEFYIKVNYKAYVGEGTNKIYYAGSNSKSKGMYIPVKDPVRTGDAFSFEAGRQYIFQLTFGEPGTPGSDINGAIEFEVTVQAWNETGPINIP
jgi:hypothetical protein